MESKNSKSKNIFIQEKISVSNQRNSILQSKGKYILLLKGKVTSRTS